MPSSAAMETGDHKVRLHYFNQPSILQQIGHRRLARFFQDFEQDLNDVPNALPFPPEPDPTWPDRLAATFARTGLLPEPILNALLLIEAAASTENAELLDSVIGRRLPCISLNRSCPLDCALELWFVCRDELPNFLTAVKSSEFEVQSSKSHPSPAPKPAESETEQNGNTDKNGRDAFHSVPDPSTFNLQPSTCNNSALLDDLAAIFPRFVILPKYAADALALWIVHTHAYKLRDVTVYIGIESPEKRCGKTTLLTVLAELAYNAIAASNISPPAFFRAIEDLSPTLLIDEADTFLTGNDALRGILNAGYKKKTAFVYRASNESPVQSSKFKVQGSKLSSPSDTSDSKLNTKNSKLDFPPDTRHPSLATFSTWCPKAIATIDRLPDTLADRCILIRMHRKARNEQCERFRNFGGEPFRQRCARFVEEHSTQIATATPELPSDLGDRAAEIWEPLFAIADLARGDWPQRARQAALHLSAAAQQSSPIASLLLDIYVGFVIASADRLLTRDLLQRLNALPDRPWMETLRGKPPTDRWLSQQLAPYGIKPRLLRRGDDVGRGYFLEDFTDTLRRYGSKAEFNALYPKPPDEPTVSGESV
jgi:Protein of unknown function (DUF3631)